MSALWESKGTPPGHMDRNERRYYNVLIKE